MIIKDYKTLAASFILIYKNKSFNHLSLNHRKILLNVQVLQFKMIL